MKVYLSEYIHPAAVEHLKAHAEIVDNFDHPGELDGMVVRGVKVTREMIERATMIANEGVSKCTIATLKFEGTDEEPIVEEGIVIMKFYKIDDTVYITNQLD